VIFGPNNQVSVKGLESLRQGAWHVLPSPEMTPAKRVLKWDKNGKHGKI
jgi:hypothetical protein